MSATSEGARRREGLAAEILGELASHPEASELVLGGYFALRQHVDYRTTHDIDAWWHTGRSERAMARLRSVMAGVAERHGLAWEEREWGETVSFDLVESGRRTFSVQVAVRSVELEPPTVGPWGGILVESLADTVGSKMNALVQRGAPRDFLDIREVVLRAVASVEQCWAWWSAKNPDLDPTLARAQALRHVEGLEQRRPLEAIANHAARSDAAAVNKWIRQPLLDRRSSAAEGQVSGPMHIDHSVFPDLEVLPDELTDPGERADYVHRICSAWDFGLAPDAETFTLFRGWRDVLDGYPLPHSPAYHAFRSWFGWPATEKGSVLETHAERLDRREGRTDPCEGMI